jgi:hypothetical protein
VARRPVSKQGEKEEGVEEVEALIRQRVADCVTALRAKDIDGVMSVYAPNLVSFDIAPPLRYVGTINVEPGKKPSLYLLALSTTTYVT